MSNQPADEDGPDPVTVSSAISDSPTQPGARSGTDAAAPPKPWIPLLVFGLVFGVGGLLCLAPGVLLLASGSGSNMSRGLGASICGVIAVAGGILLIVRALRARRDRLPA